MEYNEVMHPFVFLINFIQLKQTSASFFFLTSLNREYEALQDGTTVNCYFNTYNTYYSLYLC